MSTGWVAGGGAQVVVEAAHVGQLFFRRAGSDVAPMLADQVVELAVLEQGDFPQFFDRHLGGGQSAGVNLRQERQGKGFAAEEKLTRPRAQARVHGAIAIEEAVNFSIGESRERAN